MRDFENLAAYLPGTILKELVEGEQTFKMPQEQKFKTVCLFADVSGFTVLSEKLCAEGEDGIEELAAQLNKYMAQVVKLTSRAGGDVLKFAGDAMISVWPQDEHGGNVQEAVLRAIQCSLDMQLRLTDFGFSFRKTDKDGQDIATAKLVKGELNIKLGIGVGDVSILYVGGESDNVMAERYEYVAMGDALEQVRFTSNRLNLTHLLTTENPKQAFGAEGAAVKSQVIISKEAYDLVKSVIVAVPVPEHKGNFLVKSIHPDAELKWKKKEDMQSYAPSSPPQCYPTSTSPMSFGPPSCAV
jgi:class 3 adenylate cyclase